MSKIAIAAVSFAMLGVTATTNFTHLNPSAGSQPAKSTVTHKTVSKPVADTTPAPQLVTVQSGDTLSTIAGNHSTTFVRLFDANDFIADPDIIHGGDQVRIPTADEQLPDRPLPAATTAAAPSTTAGVTAAAVSYPSLAGNDAKAFIYSHESGNNPNSTSASGCYGLGQDCNGRVRAQCGADYACQDAYFTNYAVSRYGSWDSAAAFWQTHGWW